MQLYYQPDFESTLQLTDEEAQHATRVLRHKVGHTLQITDGHGTVFEGIIDNISKNYIDFKITKKSHFDYTLAHTEIAIAPTKNIDRIEWFTEKATEIGIKKIHFFIGEHSERKILKLERLQKIVVSAMKQSLQFYCPKITFYNSLKTLIPAFANDYNKLIAHLPMGTTPPLIQEIEKKHKKSIVLIGPEGDFSENEVIFAQQAGFQSVSLGRNRLRTETAGVVACNLMQL
jgi:16S rRNA (uracil1498-N3)-methyltransferase